jgi:hypothetical protein
MNSSFCDVNFIAPGLGNPLKFSPYCENNLTNFNKVWSTCIYERSSIEKFEKSDLCQKLGATAFGYGSELR